MENTKKKASRPSLFSGDTITAVEWVKDYIGCGVGNGYEPSPYALPARNTVLTLDRQAAIAKFIDIVQPSVGFCVACGVHLHCRSEIPTANFSAHLNCLYHLEKEILFEKEGDMLTNMTRSGAFCAVCQMRVTVDPEHEEVGMEELIELHTKLPGHEMNCALLSDYLVSWLADVTSYYALLPGVSVENMQAIFLSGLEKLIKDLSEMQPEKLVLLSPIDMDDRSKLDHGMKIFMENALKLKAERLTHLISLTSMEDSGKLRNGIHDFMENEPKLAEEIHLAPEKVQSPTEAQVPELSAEDLAITDSAMYKVPCGGSHADWAELVEMDFPLSKSTSSVHLHQSPEMVEPVQPTKHHQAFARPPGIRKTMIKYRKHGWHAQLLLTHPIWDKHMCKTSKRWKARDILPVNPYHAYCKICKLHMYEHSSLTDIFSCYPVHINSTEHRENAESYTSQSPILRRVSEEVTYCEACAKDIDAEEYFNLRKSLDSLIEDHLKLVHPSS